MGCALLYYLQCKDMLSQQWVLCCRIAPTFQAKEDQYIWITLVAQPVVVVAACNSLVPRDMVEFKGLLKGLR
jgi:hypothetical protein